MQNDKTLNSSRSSWYTAQQNNNKTKQKIGKKKWFWCERDTRAMQSIESEHGAVIKHGEHYGRVNIGVCVQKRSMLKPARNNNKAMNINRKKNR